MYSQAIAGAEGDGTLFGNRSAAYLAVGLYQEATLDAQKATTLSPTWAKGFYRHGATWHAVCGGFKAPKHKCTAANGMVSRIRHGQSYARDPFCGSTCHLALLAPRAGAYNLPGCASSAGWEPRRWRCQSGKRRLLLSKLGTASIPPARTWCAGMPSHSQRQQDPAPGMQVLRLSDAVETCSPHGANWLWCVAVEGVQTDMRAVMQVGKLAEARSEAEAEAAGRAAEVPLAP